jgi:hypothetical protein
MNCLEFRREKLAEPRRASDAARAHVQECVKCAAFARNVDEGDAELLRAMTVSVPEGLADRVLLRPKRSDFSDWRVWALAASVVAGIGLAAVFVGASPSDAYARLAVAHVIDEPESFTTEYHSDARSVAVALRSVGASVRSPLGKVRYVKLCPWENGTRAWHLVFETPQGLATLIVVADERVRSKSDAFVNGWSARIRPARRGFYAVVTSSPAITGEVDEILRARINWDA